MFCTVLLHSEYIRLKIWKTSPNQIFIQYIERSVFPFSLTFLKLFICSEIAKCFVPKFSFYHSILVYFTNFIDRMGPWEGQEDGKSICWVNVRFYFVVKPFILHNMILLWVNPPCLWFKTILKLSSGVCLDLKRIFHFQMYIFVRGARRLIKKNLIDQIKDGKSIFWVNVCFYFVVELFMGTFLEKDNGPPPSIFKIFKYFKISKKCFNSEIHFFNWYIKI